MKHKISLSIDRNILKKTIFSLFYCLHNSFKCILDTSFILQVEYSDYSNKLQRLLKGSRLLEGGAYLRSGAY